MWASSDSTMLSSFSSFPIQPGLGRASKPDSQHIQLTQHRDERCHVRSSHMTSRGQMAAINGTYTEERSEVAEWEVLSTAVDSVLPETFARRRREHGQMPASEQSEPLGSASRGFPPTTGNPPSNPKSNPSFYQRLINFHSSFRQVADTAAALAMAMPRMEEPEQGAVRTSQQDKTDKMDKTVGPALDQPATPDRRTLDLALCQGKSFISMIASVAAIMGLSADDSGVDWKFASQGLDLIFNASREFISYHNAEHDASFERATYINGAQHVLRGLPRDLEPGEAAMLHRAMPQTLGAAASGINGHHHQHHQQRHGPAGNEEGGNQNAVHVIILFCMCWLYTFGAWVMPKIALLAAKVIQAEQQHQWLPRLWLAASWGVQTAIGVFGWLRACWPVRALLAMLGYAAQGVRGALLEFGEGKLDNMAARGGAVRGRKGEVKGWK